MSVNFGGWWLKLGIIFSILSIIVYFIGFESNTTLGAFSLILSIPAWIFILLISSGTCDPISGNFCTMSDTSLGFTIITFILIFYFLVGALIGWIIDLIKGKKNKNNRSKK